MNKHVNEYYRLKLAKIKSRKENWQFARKITFEFLQLIGIAILITFAFFGCLGGCLYFAKATEDKEKDTRAIAYYCDHTNTFYLTNYNVTNH